jgi:alpha-beta hydrolase superfamily lysophospholipase
MAKDADPPEQHVYCERFTIGFSSGRVIALLVVEEKNP